MENRVPDPPIPSTMCSCPVLGCESKQSYQYPTRFTGLPGKSSVAGPYSSSSSRSLRAAPALPMSGVRSPAASSSNRRLFLFRRRRYAYRAPPAIASIPAETPTATPTVGPPFLLLFGCVVPGDGGGVGVIAAPVTDWKQQPLLRRYDRNCFPSSAHAAFKPDSTLASSPAAAITSNATTAALVPAPSCRRRRRRLLVTVTLTTTTASAGILAEEQASATAALKACVSADVNFGPENPLSVTDAGTRVDPVGEFVVGAADPVGEFVVGGAVGVVEGESVGAGVGWRDGVNDGADEGETVAEHPGDVAKSMVSTFTM